MQNLKCELYHDGSGSTLRAAHEIGRNAYGFEVDKGFYTKAKETMLNFETDGQIGWGDLNAG